MVAIGRNPNLFDFIGKWQDEFGKTQAAGHQVDMYDHDAFGGVLDTIAADESSIHILVNNAHELSPKTGFNVAGGDLAAASFDQWHRNLTGGAYWPALTTQKLGQQLMAHGKGSIINISSMYGIVAPCPALYAGTEFVNPPGYSAAKAAMLALTRYTASFWGAQGVRANAIVPGPFSNVEDQGPNSVPPDSEFVNRLKARTCLNRVGVPRELAGAIVFLASDASAYITGQAIVVDGGWTIT